MNSSHEEGIRDRNRAGEARISMVRKTKGHLKDRQLRFQLDSGREHPPRNTSSSETGHCWMSNKAKVV
eukprot:gene26251-biopygen15299